MIMSAANASFPTVEELQKLSHRAIVAYAVCAARMVQPFFGCGRYEPSLKHIATIDSAIRIAERFAEDGIDSTRVIRKVANMARTAYNTAAAAGAGAGGSVGGGDYTAARSADAAYTAIRTCDFVARRSIDTYIAARGADCAYAANAAATVAASDNPAYTDAAAQIKQSLRWIYGLLILYLYCWN